MLTILTPTVSKTGAFYTAIKRANYGFIPELLKTKCRCCCSEEGLGETVEHLLLMCSKWAQERERYLGGMIGVVENIRSIPSDMKYVLILGGGYMGVYLDNWLPPRQKPEGHVDFCKHEDISMVCGAFRVAGFLQAIAGRRHAILSSLSVSVGRDGPLQSQGPNG